MVCGNSELKFKNQFSPISLETSGSIFVTVTAAFGRKYPRGKMAGMIIDGVFPSEVSEHSNISEKAVAAFLKFVEQRLDVAFIRNTHGIPEDMLAPLKLAYTLYEKGAITKFSKIASFPDEPRIHSWHALCNDPASNEVGGSSWESDASALMATLAEALERYIWFTQGDYFVDPTIATTEKIGKKGDCIAPERFAGFTEEQRAGNRKRMMDKNTEYLWIRAMSLVRGSSVYIPAQVVNGSQYTIENRSATTIEPLIRQRTTIGLATWPTIAGARLAGALEVIERDAYMVAWLNQLTLPRISLASLTPLDATLARALESCERYRLRPHVIKLMTDAPTHAVAVVLEDMSGRAPRFSFGLRTHRSLVAAVLKALGEALHAHRNFRFREKNSTLWNAGSPTSELGHSDRVDYWAIPEHAKHLEFFVAGPEMAAEAQPWDKDTEEVHLQRVVEWCAAKGFECVSASLGTSSKNPTSLHIEQVVIPELQPAYLKETWRTFGGTRWRDVPKMFGYTALEKPYAERPHPFA